MVDGIQLASQPTLSNPALPPAQSSLTTAPTITYYDRSGLNDDEPYWFILGSSPTQFNSDGTVSTMGHAYVLYGTENDPSTGSSTLQGWEFTPEDGATADTIPIPQFVVSGNLVPQLEQHGFDWLQDASQLTIVQTDQISYWSERTVINSWNEETQTYQSLTSNSTAFVQNVAESAGFPSPTGVSVFPDQAVTALDTALAQPVTFMTPGFNGNAGITYTGTVWQGMPYGTGSMTYSDGSSYKGEWVEDLWNGRGTYTIADGTSLTGIWTNGQVSPTQTTWTFPDGEIYNGPASGTGTGTITWPNQDSYTGPTNNGNIVSAAQGTWNFPNGETYTGIALGSGTGQIKWSDGSTYSGGVINAIPNGSGQYVSGTDHRTLSGTFANGALTKGTINYPSRLLYTLHGDGTGRDRFPRRRFVGWLDE